nr:AAA family ATPase [Candidatus Goldiibacteriota bacterium]
MKLKELEIFGFKSFADRTYIRFDEGITVVVGPNGSGKSNIFDSIRWVLGSQSAKSLRGSKMEDVIFIGSDDRKTLGMAEVSLTFLNNDRSLNIDYEEVKVTRRLYRSGESEYFINDNPVRLKDILELFMDTGVGIDSYSIISQGEVDRIINAKPVERREIFEEAAGITKYIKKRDEALRKLESTEQNMLRINDILVEVKRQTASLERQAKKAEKYKEIKEEWSSIAVRLLMKELKDRIVKQRELEGENGDVERRIEEENTKLSTHEMKFEEMKLLAIEKEREINEKKEKWLIRQQEIKRLEDNLKFLSQRHVELSQRIEELRAQNVENVGKIEGVKVELEDKTRLLSELTEKIAFRQDALNALTSEYDGLILSFEDARRIKEQNVNLVQSKTAELNGMVNKMVEAESSLRNTEEAISRHEEEKKTLEDKARSVAAELSRLSENRGFKEGEIKKIKDREEILIKEKIIKSESLDVIDNILKELNLGISRMESRHSFLRQLHERMEGFGETVRKVLTEYKDGLDEDKKDNVVDVVANLIA